MQCHKPGHRASARCVSALLAAGALLAAAADDLGGTSERPAIQTAAFGIPSALNSASLSALLTERRERPAESVLSRIRARPALEGPHTASGRVRPSPAMSDPSPPWSRRRRKKHSKHHRLRHRPVSDRNTEGRLLADLPPVKDGKAAAAVHEAMNLIGVPYRWGGTTRAGGFDCSGFTQHIWAVAGVKIPRTVRAQARAGTRVALNKAQPGDLVVFYPTQHHVGVYVGNGLVIDSPHTGARVRPDPVRSMPVSEVVRVQA